MESNPSAEDDFLDQGVNKTQAQRKSILGSVETGNSRDTQIALTCSHSTLTS